MNEYNISVHWIIFQYFWALIEDALCIIKYLQLIIPSTGYIIVINTQLQVIIVLTLNNSMKDIKFLFIIHVLYILLLLDYLTLYFEFFLILVFFFITQFKTLHWKCTFFFSSKHSARSTNDYNFSFFINDYLNFISNIAFSFN